METNLLPGIEIDYSVLDNAIRKETSVSAMCAPHPLSSDKQSGQGNQTVVAAVTMAAATAPLLDPDLYFGDILGDDGVPPQALPTMMKSDDLEDTAQVEMHKSYPLGNGMHYSDQAPITSEELSHHRVSRADEDSVAGLSGATQYDQAGLSTAPTFLSSVNREGSSKHAVMGVPNFSGIAAAESLGGSLSLEKSNGHLMVSPMTEKVEASILNYDEMSVNDSAKSSSDAGSDGDEDKDTVINSPASGSSMTNGQMIGTHPDLYENLSPQIRDHIDQLREKIAAMPRRKLRESLAREVTIEDVEPLMFVNRDELAGMLGLGVTTWKTFMHSLGVPRWPARALKSQQGKEKKLLEKKDDAEKRGDADVIMKVNRDLEKLRHENERQRSTLKNNARLRVANVTMKKKRSV